MRNSCGVKFRTIIVLCSKLLFCFFFFLIGVVKVKILLLINKEINKSIILKSGRSGELIQDPADLELEPDRFKKKNRERKTQCDPAEPAG
jgi:hypothetical protein